MEIKDLERALVDAGKVSDGSASAILKEAVRAFLEAQGKVHPVKHEDSDWIKKVNQFVVENNKDRCPACGMRGAHYCTGRPPSRTPFSPSNGIEYWYNQPTAVVNGDINGQGIKLGKSFGISCC